MDFSMGSSPRVRGSRAVPAGRHEPGGIIPAGAGLTMQDRRRRASRGDHPRGCGAHDGLPALSYTSVGSSPRVRGSQRTWEAPETLSGIIPAGAGLTLSMTQYCSTHSGSSPRVRGSPFFTSGVSVADGIIPAGAGLTPRASVFIFCAGDHPRGCGAHRN